MFLPCGHTFCSYCLRQIYKNSSVICPLDKKDHSFPNFNDIVINYSIIEALDIHYNNKDEKRCNIHKNEILKFYCKNHE